MKYLGVCENICSEALDGITLIPHNKGFIGRIDSVLYMYISIKEDEKTEAVMGKFDVSNLDITFVKSIIDSLCAFGNDYVKKITPITDRQMASLKSIVVNNPPKSSIYPESQPYESILLGIYKSGDNATIKCDSKVIFDVNGKNNASKILSILGSAVYNLIDTIKKQINAPE